MSVLDATQRAQFAFHGHAAHVGHLHDFTCRLDVVLIRGDRDREIRRPPRLRVAPDEVAADLQRLLVLPHPVVAKPPHVERLLGGRLVGAAPEHPLEIVARLPEAEQVVEHDTPAVKGLAQERTVGVDVDDPVEVFQRLDPSALGPPDLAEAQPRLFAEGPVRVLFDQFQELLLGLLRVVGAGQAFGQLKEDVGQQPGLGELVDDSLIGIRRQLVLRVGKIGVAGLEQARLLSRRIRELAVRLHELRGGLGIPAAVEEPPSLAKSRLRLARAVRERLQVLLEFVHRLRVPAAVEQHVGQLELRAFRARVGRHGGDK